MSAYGQVRAVNGAVGCAPPAEQRASVTYKPGPQSGSSGSSGEGGPGSGDGREGRECLPAWEGGVLGAEREQDLPNMSSWGWSTWGLAWSPSDFLPAHPAPPPPHPLPRQSVLGGGQGRSSTPAKPQGGCPGPGHLGWGGRRLGSSPTHDAEHLLCLAVAR